MIGRTLNHYEILEKLGEGGMGEVYLARDTKLGRSVAIKMLPEELASDDERRRRFEREARTIAALDHPNVVTIFSVEESDGIPFITMERVRGRTLKDLLPENGFDIDDFLKLAIPFVAGLEAAHREGVVHRDLKPGNVMVSDEGRVKVLDFGLAKFSPATGEPVASSMSTRSGPMTAEGHIMGTIRYMSPEQAEGRPLDERSDIFSLGIVFFELLTGCHPFDDGSKTPLSLLSSILKDAPPLVTDIRPSIPDDLARVVKRCLAKDPGRRFQTARDVRIEFEEIAHPEPSGATTLVRGVAASAETTPRVGSRAFFVSLIAALAVGFAVVSYQLYFGGDDAMRPEFTRLTSRPGPEFFPTLSPDGDFVVYASRESGHWDIHLQRVGGERAINLTEDSAVDDWQPAFSPDGGRIAFRSERDGGGLFIMGATGESARRVTDFGFNPTWSPDSTQLAFGTEGVDTANRLTVSELWTVDVDTGETQKLTEQDAVGPSWSPNGHRIAFWSVADGERDVWTISASGGTPAPLTLDLPRELYIDPAWSPDGRHLYFASSRGGSNNLWRVGIDESSGARRGQPEPVTLGPGTYKRHPRFARSSGQLVYADEVRRQDIYRVDFEPGRLDRNLGPPERVTREGGSNPTLSPDETLLAFTEGGNIYVIGADGTGRRKLTDDRGYNVWPRWSPDGSGIAFHSNRTGSYEVWIIRPDGSGLRPLTDTPEAQTGWPEWAPDGRRLAYYTVDRGGFIMDVEQPFSEQTPVAFPMLEEGGFRATSWSPDGASVAGTRWLPNGEYEAGILYHHERREFEVVTEEGFWPTFVPDGSGLILRRGGENVFLIDLDSRERHEIWTMEGRGAFELTRDRSALYFQLRTIEADIWMLELRPR